MPWVKLDDGCSYHPKARKAGLEAWGLYVASITYSAKLLKDGFVAKDSLPDVWPWGGNLEKLADRLVRAGLWDAEDGGWRVHDYLDFQPSREQVLSEREGEKQRKRKARSHLSARTPDGHQEDGGRSPDAVQRASEIPVPSRPVPKEPDPPHPDLGGAGFAPVDDAADYSWNRREMEREISAERGKPWSLPSNRFGLAARADAVVEEIRDFAAREKADPRAVCATAFRAWSERQVIVKRSAEPHLWLDDWAGSLPAKVAS